MELMKQRLNAGDLSLSFRHKEAGPRRCGRLRWRSWHCSAGRWRSWMAEQASWRGKQFKLAGEARELEAQPQLVEAAGRAAPAVCPGMFWLAKGYVVLARHDQARDRLVIVDATDEALARELMDSVGWARTRTQDEGLDGCLAFWSRKPKITRQQALAAKPVQLAKCTVAETPDGGAKLKVPLKPTRIAGTVLAHAGRLDQDLRAGGDRLLRLEQCDGKTSVQQIIRRLARQYNMSLRETEVSTVAFLQTLVRKGLVGMAVPEKKDRLT